MNLIMPLHKPHSSGIQEQNDHCSMGRGDRGKGKRTILFSRGHGEVHGIADTTNIDREIPAALRTRRDEGELTDIHSMPPKSHAKSLEAEGIAATYAISAVFSHFTPVNICQSRDFKTNEAGRSEGV
jgi:hypothetical protein